MNDSTSTATINDVARLAGVSKRTVSRVLNNSPKVNPETREKIQQIIAELDYAPSKQARGLASSRSYLLGLLYDEPNAIVIHSVQKGILSACASHGYEMVVHPCAYQSESLTADVLNFVTRSKLDGLIIMPPISANEALTKALQDKGIPYVRLAAIAVDAAEKVVISDDRSAMRQVAELFHRRGCKDVAVILGPPHRLASKERFEGLQSALGDLGIQINSQRVVEGDFTYESGLLCAKQLLSAKSRPDAVFASNDQMAIAVIHTAEDLGLKVPGDLLVVGYDDEPMASRLRPSLTTLQRPNADMARAAALKLIAAASNNEQILNELPTVFTPQLICRQSTADVAGE
ncbi:MAG: LacI family transcriptional regulator [Gammaproteobacteria bacterium]|uniref:LacI family DNA-binding transcriptional regulator n=1 Tax=Pseudomaricurvus alcaniphilus TaxID=1166482 RepID=UPI00140CC9E3|nr:LacI family DNA-binding transcriptional regulator [Pseudomaricurvus alcaniphilus]MBR9911439.1 LacI family transcriptional regulator [Gammaproteobacteria bacterium]NHN36807.1 LacI family transcriptional regulator [Pseudomaricurvus alcaniphilus]